MARIPILQGPGQIQTGNQTLRVPELQAVNNNAVAQGLAKVGQVAFDISERAKRAQDVTNLTNASMAMQNAQLEFAKFQQENPDESAWMGKWNEIQTRLKTDFDKMPLTPDARLQLQDRVTNWSTRGTIMVQAEAFKQTGQRAKQSIENAFQYGRQTGDFAPVKQAVKDYQSSGLPLPEEVESINLSISGAERQKAAEDFKVRFRMAQENGDGLAMYDEAFKAKQMNIISDAEFDEVSTLSKQVEEKSLFKQMAIANPVEAMKKLSDSKEFNAVNDTDKAGMAAMAQGILKDYQAREVNEFADHVFVTGSTDGFRFQWNTSPAERAKIIEDAKPADKLTDVQIARKKLEVESMIERYDPSADTTGMGALFITKNILEVQRAIPQFATELSSMWTDAKKGGQKDEFSMEIANFDEFLSKYYGSKFKALENPDGSLRKGKENEFRQLQQEVTDKKKAFRLQIGQKDADSKKTGQNTMALPVGDDVTNYFDMLERSPNPMSPTFKLQPQAIPGQ
jgi:hypothetical protein